MRIDVNHFAALKYLPFIFVLLGLGNFPVKATEMLTVKKAVESALKHNPDLLAIRQEVEMARGRKVKADLFSQFNPNVNAQVWNRNNPGSGNVTDSQVLVSQEVEVAGQRGLRREEAAQNVIRVEAQVKDRERIIIKQVKLAFYQALTLKKRLGLRRKIEKLNFRIRNASRERFKSGVVPIMESNLAEIRYGQSRKETFVTKAAFQNALLNFRRLLGWELDHSFELVGQLRNSSGSLPLSDLLQIARSQRPDLMAAKKEVDRAKIAMDLTRRLIVPNPTFQVFHQTETEGPQGTSEMIGGGVSIPIPIFNRNQGELVTQGGELNRGRHQIIAITQNIEQEVKTAYQTYEAARQSVEVFEAEVIDRIEDNFKFIEISYREGKIGLLQLIVVQDDLITVQLSYVESLGQFRRAEVNLEQAVGGKI